MNSKDIEDILKRGLIAPQCYPVHQTAIEAAKAAHTIHPDLVVLWRTAGYGFFTSDVEGNALTGFLNRVSHPDEIAPTIQRKIEEDDTYAIGLPFFEMADDEFLLLMPDGSILNPSDDENEKVASDLNEFLVMLFQNPEFYLSRTTDRKP